MISTAPLSPMVGICLTLLGAAFCAFAVYLAGPKGIGAAGGGFAVGVGYMVTLIALKSRKLAEQMTDD